MEIKLILKYVDGTANNEEKEVLEKWLDLDKKNKDFFERVKEILNSTKEYQLFQNIDIDKDWSIVESKLKNISEKKHKNVLKSPFVRISLQIAAILILAFIINIVFFREKEKEEQYVDAYNEIYVPEGQKSEITLTDGTKVKINAGSKLKLPNEFGGDTRDVWLEGEAYFDVAHNTEKPFFVHTSRINIQVFGTSFNVRAYLEEDLIETTLIDGAVSLRRIKEDGMLDTEVVKLEPNHKAVFFNSKNAYVTEKLVTEINQPLEVKKILISEPVDPNLTISWTEGKLIFENEKFTNIIPQLERYYGVKIQVKDNVLNDVRYTGTIKNVSVEQTIKALQITSQFDFEINDNLILITKKNNSAYVR